jgi:hypothetical protein
LRRRWPVGQEGAESAVHPRQHPRLR